MLRAQLSRTGLLLLLLACSTRREAASPAPKAEPRKEVVISLIGTSDVHGRLQAQDGVGGLDVFAGYMANLRRARAENGAVVLVDAGDMFQGTLESNLAEGAGMVEAYNALGYAAAAIGNHEFDFGPAGPATTPQAPGDDPRGALVARAREARFPFLAANIRDRKTKEPLACPNCAPSTIVEAAGVPVGIIGVTTEATPRTTMAANFAGLEMEAPAAAIEREAAALRAKGARVIIVAAHIGGDCQNIKPPQADCDPDEEIMRVLKQLAPGTVHAVVAGHTHKTMANLVHGVPVIESQASGKQFGRIDLIVDGNGNLVRTEILAPTDVRLGATYEGAQVAPDAAIARLLADDLERAAARKAQNLGVELADEIRRSYDHESELGNLFADLMRASQKTDVAITNGGGLRANLPAGPLAYGALFEAYPFDNRFALVDMTGAELGAALVANLGKSGGILSLGGIRARAACGPDGLTVAIERENGRRVGPRDSLRVALSDFLATGGDGFLKAAGVDQTRATILDVLVREEMAAVLTKRGGTVRGSDLLDAKRPRFSFPGERPVRCK